MPTPNREEVLRTIQLLQQDIAELARRLDRLAAALDAKPDIGGLYQEQVQPGGAGGDRTPQS